MSKAVYKVFTSTTTFSFLRQAIYVGLWSKRVGNKGTILFLFLCHLRRMYKNQLSFCTYIWASFNINILKGNSARTNFVKRVENDKNRTRSWTSNIYSEKSIRLTFILPKKIYVDKFRSLNECCSEKGVNRTQKQLNQYVYVNDIYTTLELRGYPQQICQKSHNLNNCKSKIYM